MSESNALANGLAGAGGGIIAQILTYPLQTVLNPNSSFSLLYSLSHQFHCNLQVNTRQQTERTLKRNKQSLLPHSSNTATAPAPAIFLQIFQVQISFPSFVLVCCVSNILITFKLIKTFFRSLEMKVGVDFTVASSLLFLELLLLRLSISTCFQINPIIASAYQ